MPFSLKETQTISSATRFVMKNPNIRDFAVLDENDRVTGFLPMSELAKYTLTKVFPKLTSEVEIDHILPPSIVKTISLPPVTVHFEDTLQDAIKIILSHVSSEVHIVNADNVLLGSLVIEKLFSILHETGSIKKL